MQMSHLPLLRYKVMDSTTGKQSERINDVEALDGVVKAILLRVDFLGRAFNSTLLFDVRSYARPVRRFRRFFRPRAPFLAHAARR